MTDNNDTKDLQENQNQAQASKPRAPIAALKPAEGSNKSRGSTPQSNLREPLVQILNDSEFSSPLKAHDASSIMEKLEFSGNQDFPHFSNKQMAGSKLSKQLQKRHINTKMPKQIDGVDVPCTPVSQADQKIITLNKMNADLLISQNVIFDGDSDRQPKVDHKGFFIKDEYFSMQRNFAKSVSDNLLGDKQFKNDVKKLIQFKNMDQLSKINDEGSSMMAASQDNQSENIGQEAKANFADTANPSASVIKAREDTTNSSKPKKAPRHETAGAMGKKPRQSIPLYKNSSTVATAQINLKSHRKQAKKTRSQMQALPPGSSPSASVHQKQSANDVPKLQKHNSHRQINGSNSKTTPERSVLAGYQKNLGSKNLSFRNSFTQESVKGLNQSGSRINNDSITPRLQKDKKLNKTNESKEHSKELIRRISPQPPAEEESSKRANNSLRTSCKKSVTDYSQIMLTNSRNYNTKNLDTKSSIPSIKNLDIKSETGSQLNQELLERMSSQRLFDGSDADNSNNIKVVIRIRPFNQREVDDQTNRTCVEVQNAGTQVKLDYGGQEAAKVFNFDFVGDSSIDQMSIFNHIARPIADSCMQGYNGTIFAYGQTGAGKTYTIQGPCIQTAQTVVESQDSHRSSQNMQEERGIMQRSFEYIFQCIEAEKSMVKEKENGSALQFLVKCSFLEIYNEQIIDLLDTNAANLQIREDINKGVYVEGLSEEIVTSEQDMLEIILRGANNRHVGATNMNRSSSRSHSVLTTIIESKSRSATGVWNVKQSRFHIIDLAGSERQKVAKTVGDRLKEAGMINKSLSALGNVINSLVDVSEGKNRHVPYRDSKLTFILRDSLGGNSKTAIIANVSPSHLNYNETLSTLKFAQRAKLIKNQAVINEDSSGTIVLLKNEIKKLKKELTDSASQVAALQNEKQGLKENIARFSEMQQSFQGICKICKNEETTNSNCIDFSQLVEANATGDHADVFVYSQQSDSSIEAGKGENRLSNILIPSSTENQIKTQKNQKDLAQSVSTFETQQTKIIQRKSLDNREKLLQERVIRAEKLLNHKLLEYTNKEKIISSLEDQVKKLTNAMELQDHEILRMRELMDSKDKLIRQLEDQANFDEEDAAKQYRQEIDYLKEIIRKQIDQEESPVVLKLQSQIDELSVYKESVTSFDAQGRSYKDYLNEKLAQQQKLIDELNEYINSKCTMSLLLTAENNHKDLKAKYDKLEQDHKELNEQLDQLQQKFDTLQGQNIELDKKCQTATRDLARAKLEIQGSSVQFKQYEKTISLKQSELDQKQKDMQALKKEQAQQMEILKQEHVTDLNNQIDALKLGHSKEIASFNTKLEEMEAKLGEKASKIEQEISHGQTIQKKLENEKKERQQVVKELEKVLEREGQLKEVEREQRDTCVKLDLKYKLLEKLVTEKTEELVQSSETIDRLSQERTSLMQELDALKQDYQKVDTQLKDSLNEKQTLQNDLQAQQKISTEYDQSIKKQKEEMEVLTSQIATMNSQIQSIEQEKEGLNVNCDEQSQRIKKIQEDIDAKEEQIKVREGEIEELKVAKEKLNEEIETLQQKILHNQTCIEQFEQEKELQLCKIAELDEKILDFIESQKTLESQLQEVQIKNEEQSKQLEERQNNIESLQSQNKTLESQKKTLESQKKTMEQDHQKTVLSMSTQLNDQKASFDTELTSSNRTFASEKSQFERRIEQLQSQIASLEKSKLEMTSEVAQLQVEQTVSKATIAEQQEQQRNQTKKTQELLMKLQTAQNDLQRQRLDMQAQQISMAKLTTDLQTLGDEKEALRVEFEKVMDDYTEALMEIQRQKQVEEEMKAEIEAADKQRLIQEQMKKKLSEEMGSKSDLLQEFQKQIEESKLEYKKQGESLQALEDQLKTKVSDYENAVKQIQMKDCEINELNESILETIKLKEEIEANLKETQSEIENLKVDLNGQQTKVEENQKIIDNLKEQLKQAQDDHQIQLMAQSEKGSQAIEEKVKVIKDLQHQISIHQSTDKKLREDQKVKEQRVQELQNALGAQMDLIAKYQQQLEDANEGIKKLQDEVCDAKDDMQKMEDKFREELAQQVKQTEAKEEQNKALQDMQTIQNTKISNLESDISSKQSRIENEVQKCGELEHELSQKILSFTKELDSMKNQNQQKEEELRAREEEIEGLKQTCESRTVQIEKLKQEIVALKQENNQLCTQLTKLQSKNKELTLITQEQEVKIKDDKEETMKKEKKHEQDLDRERKLVQQLKANSIKEVESLRQKCLQDVQRAHEQNEKETDEQLKSLQGQHDKEVEKIRQDQYKKQQGYLSQIEQLQGQMKQVNSSIFFYEKIIDRIKTSLSKKTKVVEQGNIDQEAAGSFDKLIDSFNLIDKQIASLNSEDDDDDSFTVVSNELIGQITKILDYAQSLHKQEQSILDQKNVKLAKEIEQLNQKYEHQRQTSSNISKLQGQLEEERQRDQKEYEQSRKQWEKEKKEQESQFAQKLQSKDKEKSTLKDLIQQQKDKIQDKEKEVEKMKQKAADVGVKKDKLELQLNKEHDQRKKIQAELENYKIYLPEAENLLQEVNKRHQAAQKEIESMKFKLAKEKESYENQIKQQQSDIDVYKEKIMKGKDQFGVLQERNKELESRKVSLERKLNCISTTQQSDKQKRDILSSQNQQYAQQIKSLQDDKSKMITEMTHLQDHIKQREQEMRELVKTLKKFKEQKDQADLELDTLRNDVNLLQGSQNTNYKIQMHLKMKDDCNRLKEENKSLLNEVQKLRRGKPQVDDVEPISGVGSEEQSDHPKLRKQFIMLINHLISLPWIDKVITKNRIFIQNLGRDQVHFSPQQFTNLLDLISKLDETICELRRVSHDMEIKYPPTIKAQHSHMLRQYQKNSNSLSKLQPNQQKLQDNSRQSLKKREPANISQSENSIFNNNIIIRKPHQSTQNPSEQFHAKREAYFQQRTSQKSDDSHSSLQNKKDQTLTYIPASVRDESKRQMRQGSRQDTLTSYQTSQPALKSSSMHNSHHKMRLQKADPPHQSLGSQMRLDLQRIQRFQDTKKTTQTSRPAKRTDEEGSPIILNSYSSIYHKNRENSKNSKNSDSKTGISARKYQNSQMARQVSQKLHGILSNNS